MTPPRPPAFEVRPLTPERWPDLETIFAGRGLGVARNCWCMYYRESGAAPARPAGMTLGASRRAALKSLVDAGRPTGLIGYREGVPVGWVAVAPREDYAKLLRSPVMKVVDARAVWSIICFVVPAEHRGQGVAKALLAGVVEWARGRRIDLLEAYPVDRPGRAKDDTLWFGPQSMYLAAGFEEVARRKPQRTVVRLHPA